MGWPLFTVEVAGDSMMPRLNPGDWLLAARVREVRPGDVVVARREGVGLIVKRVTEVRQGPAGRQVWLQGDNVDPVRTTDSRAFGWVDQHAVEGRVVLRFRRGRASGRR